MDRPVGQDKSKKKINNIMTSNSSSMCLEVLQKISTDRIAYEARVEAAIREMASRLDKQLAIQEKQLQLQQEMLQLQKQDWEDKIMNMDLDKMAPWV
jgi:primosomal protein N''